MLVLGIETACDDTGIGVVQNERVIRANVIWNQATVHKRFGGVVPELAAREHLRVFNLALQEALDIAKVKFTDLDAVGVNCKHGLLRSVVVGVSAAKALALALDIPLVGVHHIEGHIFSNFLAHRDLPCPHICLTVAGGHTLLIRVNATNDYSLLGKTLDDSAGEVIDKVAREIGLGFPGGAGLERLAAGGDEAAVGLPRPLVDSTSCDFSFSGIKTAARRALRARTAGGPQFEDADLAASLQAAIFDVLVKKSVRAAAATEARVLTVAGGVAVNKRFRTLLKEEADPLGIDVLYPPPELCGDNGAMIAALASSKLREGIVSDLYLEAYASAPIGGHAYK